MSIGIINSTIGRIQRIQPVYRPLAMLSKALPLPGLMCSQTACFLAKKTVSLLGPCSVLIPKALSNTYHQYCLRQAQDHLDYLKPLIYSSPYLVDAMLLSAAVYEKSRLKAAYLYLYTLSLVLPHMIMFLMTYFPSLQRWINPDSLMGEHLSSTFEKIKPQIAENLICPLVRHSHRFALKQTTRGLFYLGYQYYISSQMLALCNQLFPSIINHWHLADRSITWAHRGITAYIYGPVIWHTSKVVYQFFRAYRNLNNPQQKMSYTELHLYKRAIYDLSKSELRALSTLLSAR